MATKSSQDLVAKQKQIFDIFDKNKDGTICKRELGEAMRKMGYNPTQKEVEAMINREDIDGDGSISFSEFQNLLAKRESPRASREAMKQAFKKFDKNGDGFITVDEMQSAMAGLGDGNKMSEQEFKDLIKEADVDGDGKINYAEFCSHGAIQKLA